MTGAFRYTTDCLTRIKRWKFYEVVGKPLKAILYPCGKVAVLGLPLVGAAPAPSPGAGGFPPAPWPEYGSPPFPGGLGPGGGYGGYIGPGGYGGGPGAYGSGPVAYGGGSPVYAPVGANTETSPGPIIIATPNGPEFVPVGTVPVSPVVVSVPGPGPASTSTPEPPALLLLTTALLLLAVVQLRPLLRRAEGE